MSKIENVLKRTWYILAFVFPFVNGVNQTFCVLRNLVLRNFLAKFLWYFRPYTIYCGYGRKYTHKPQYVVKNG